MRSRTRTLVLIELCAITGGVTMGILTSPLFTRHMWVLFGICVLLGNGLNTWLIHRTKEARGLWHL